MAVEEKKRKHKDKSEKKSKKKHKADKETRIEPSSTTISAVSANAPASSFSEVHARLYIHLAPMWAGKTMEGVNEQLNAFLMK